MRVYRIELADGRAFKGGRDNLDHNWTGQGKGKIYTVEKTAQNQLDALRGRHTRHGVHRALQVPDPFTAYVVSYDLAPAGAGEALERIEAMLDAANIAQAGHDAEDIAERVRWLGLLWKEAADGETAREIGNSFDQKASPEGEGTDG